MKVRGGTVVDLDGRRGEIIEESERGSSGDLHVMVQMEDRQRLWVPARVLKKHQDGHYLLPLRVADTPQNEVEPGSPLVIPVIAETLNVRRRQFTRGGVRIHKRVRVERERVEPLLTNAIVEVERVPVNREVTEIPQVREEGDTMIFPVLEEVLVVEKRLILREEVRITRRQEQVKERHDVILRREEVEVERFAAPRTEPSGTPAVEGDETKPRKKKMQSNKYRVNRAKGEV